MREKMHAKQVETFSEFRLITLILLVITGSQGRLTDVPKNNIVSQGATAEFTCCSDIQEPLFWKVKHISSPYIEYIYDDGLVNGFRNNGRFNVTDGNRSGCYRLVIADVRANDAGTYYCVDHRGLGQLMAWELVIVESLHCKEKYRKAEYMGENKFGLPEDVIFTVCISKYIGNIPPKPICGWSSGTQIFDNHQHVTETNLTTTLTILMPARKEFNGDQLSCYLKIDGKASDNQTMTAWRSSHLIINYASFHQWGVSQCSVADLFLDCQPPCNYNTALFSNGSSYCEITYPNITRRKFFVSLQDKDLPQTALISSTTNLPVEKHLTGMLLFGTASLLAGIMCCALAGATAFIIIKRKMSLRRNMLMHEMTTHDPDISRDTSLRRNKLIREMDTIDPDFSGDGQKDLKTTQLYVDGATDDHTKSTSLSNAFDVTDISLQRNKLIRDMATIEPVFSGDISLRRNKLIREMATIEPDFSGGHHPISRPGIVITMGDFNTVTINTVYGRKQGSVTTQKENDPLLTAFSTMDLIRTPSITFPEIENVLIRGVAVLGEHLFVAYRRSSQLRVYSANTFGYKTSWNLNEITRPQDITACSEKNCLYISNIKRKSLDCEILKVSPRGSLTRKWETGINYFGHLSVTDDFNVVLAVQFNRRLLEYDTNGTLLREIQLQDDLRPNYALKEGPDYYFVSHGFGEDLEHGVSKVNADGRVLKRFGNTKGSTNQQLNNPGDLVIIDESIWVADSRNGRVIILTPTLEYQTTLLSKKEDELSCPLRICIDPANRRLLLSDFQNQNHFLRVFNFI